VKKEENFKMEKYDFSGWATRNDLLCADGRTIRHNAFKDDDGKTVPVIWNHDHGNPEAVLGHALLKNCDDGVYAYVKLNDTPQGKNARTIVQHGDVRSLSIYANKLKQIGKDVIHGSIKELSLVLAGANPGATIDFVMAQDDEEGESVIANYDENAILLYHSDEAPEEPDIEHSETKKEDKPVAEEKKTTAPAEGEGKTVKEVWDGITKKLDEDEMTVIYAMIGEAASGADDDSGFAMALDSSFDTKRVVEVIS
jgi:HK97 family phage prohead protease